MTASAAVLVVQLVPSVDDAQFPLRPTAAKIARDGDHATPLYQSVSATTVLSVQLVPFVEDAPFFAPETDLKPTAAKIARDGDHAMLCGRVAVDVLSVQLVPSGDETKIPSFEIAANKFRDGDHSILLYEYADGVLAVHASKMF